VEHATSRTPPVVATDGTGVVSHARDGTDGLHPLGDECPGRGEPLGEQPLKAGLSCSPNSRATACQTAGSNQGRIAEPYEPVPEPSPLYPPHHHNHEERP